MNPYKVLKVTPLHTREEVEKEYLNLRKDDSANFDEIEEAYQIIVSSLNKTVHERSYISNVEHELSNQSVPKLGGKPKKSSNHRDIQQKIFLGDQNYNQQFTYPSISSKISHYRSDMSKASANNKKYFVLPMAFLLVTSGVLLSNAAHQYYINNKMDFSLLPSGEEDWEGDYDEGYYSEDESYSDEVSQDEYQNGDDDQAYLSDMAIGLVNDISPVFFTDLQNSLKGRTDHFSEIVTNKFRSEFRPIVERMEENHVVFEGEIHSYPISSSNIIEVTDSRVVAIVEADYSSLSYVPYLREEPEGSEMEWQLTILKEDGYWKVDERKLISDSSNDRIDSVRPEVKKDIVDTIYTNARDWEQAYRNKDSSYFTRIRSSDYIKRQESYYRALDQNDWYWQGEYVGLEFSGDSIKIEESNPIKATIEARIQYSGEYLDEDTMEFAEEDDSKPSVFQYNLEFDYEEQSWYIVDTTLLKQFSEGDIQSYSSY